MSSVRIEPSRSLTGTIAAPSDKSITHRAIMIAAISDGDVRVTRTLDSADTAATLQIMRACGVEIEGDVGGDLVIHGRGVRGLRPAPALDCANAGTLMRLVSGLLVGQAGDRTVLDGDDSLRGRPMSRIATPLRAMGARVWTAPGGTPPIVIGHGDQLVGIAHELPVASAQVKSCLLLAALFADGETWVLEPAPSRDHTERMLAASGVPIIRDGPSVGVRGPVDTLHLPDLTVPGDASSAAFAFVAGALLGDPAVRVVGVNLNPARTGLIRVLERMGADISVVPGADVAGEPCGDVIVRRAERLQATDVTADEVPALIDELPLVALLGVFAAGTTSVRGAGELRVKESDRIATVVGSLRALGARIDERDDGFDIHGTGRLPGGAMASSGDHRLAMLGALAGMASVDGVSVDGFDAVNVSYPTFAADMGVLGARIR